MVLFNGDTVAWVEVYPCWGTHKKMNESNEQERCEFVRLKHHSLAEGIGRETVASVHNPMDPTLWLVSLP